MNYRNNEKRIESKTEWRVAAFLVAVHEVYKKHGLCIDHDDIGFIIEEYHDEEDFERLKQAVIGRSVKDRTAAPPPSLPIQSRLPRERQPEQQATGIQPTNPWPRE